MRAIYCAVVVAGLLGTGSATAKDNMGYVAIQAGNYAAAERTILAERKIYPKRPELMLNLALIYGRTGRQVEAQALYRNVLKEPEVMLDTLTGTASSHAIARAALSRMSLAST